MRAIPAEEARRKDAERQREEEMRRLQAERKKTESDKALAALATRAQKHEDGTLFSHTQR